ncbi:MAG: hypothetical protein KAS66_08930 [Candidatus Omnitrophica bacterium]|nr:hypothetical protein [Candidatus Omnitrophota bacterium]
MQKIAIKDKILKMMFGIDLLGITEHDGKISLSFFGEKGHRDIEITRDPLEKTGSGCIMVQNVFDAKVEEFEALVKCEE